MSDLIDRQAAIDTLNVCAELLRRVLDDTDIVGIERTKYEWGLGLIESFISDMEELPSAEPKRRKGRWQITDAYPHNVYCSECHVKSAQTNWAVWEDGSLPRNFCPNCGAKMGGSKNERRCDQHSGGDQCDA